MKREILFRGINFQKEWVYGDLFHSYANDDVAIAYYKEGSKTPTFDAVFPESVGQYTDLKDKNGKKIFEGDIIRVSEYENILTKEFSNDPSRFDMFTLDEIKGDLQQSFVSPVTWEEGSFFISTKGDWLHHNDMFLSVLFGDMKRSSSLFDFDVIGNIHDNPELIK